jgi:hypothetical protein
MMDLPCDPIGASHKAGPHLRREQEYVDASDQWVAPGYVFTNPIRESLNPD